MPAARRNFSALYAPGADATEPNGDRSRARLGIGDEVLHVFQGRDAGTIITLALEPIISTEARRVVASKVRLAKIAGAIVSAEDAPGSHSRRARLRHQRGAERAPRRCGFRSRWVGPSSAERRSNTKRGRRRRAARADGISP